MPAYYPRPMPRELPLTPPEFYPTYNASGCGGMPYQQGPFAGHPSMGVPKDGGYDYAERYGPHAPMPASSAMMYHHAVGYPSTGMNASAMTRCYDPLRVPALPPMRTNDGMLSDSGVRNRSQEQLTRMEQPPKEEKPVGGVSATLDYDLDVMTDFVTDMAQGLIQPGMAAQPQPAFRKWVHSVLSATRLPSATIVLSLHYLTIRMTMLSNGGQYRGPTDQIYSLLTIALALGSKFLDDNTFINRSWSDVSGIKVTELNRIEADWLMAMEFKLHRDPDEQQGFKCWVGHWKEYEAQSAARAVRTNKLAPIDTSVLRQNSVHSVHSAFSPAPPQPTFGKPTAPEFAPKTSHAQYTPAYTHFDPWLVPRSATDSSPCSAPHTGPTTPEYYGGPGTWAPPDGYSRRTMFGFPAVSQAPLQVHNYAPEQFTPQYTPSMWTGHSGSCACFHCSRQHAPTYVMTGYGPQSVAG